MSDDGDQLHLFDDDGKPLARDDDPATSHAAAERFRQFRRAKRQREVLAVFGAHPDLTAMEATELGRVPGGWKRVNELVDRGYLVAVLDDTGRQITRKFPDGDDGGVYRITAEGRAALEATA